jgi:hypothetical protein
VKAAKLLLGRSEVNANSAFRTLSNTRGTAEAKTGILYNAFSRPVNNGDAINPLTFGTNTCACSDAVALLLIDDDARHVELG